MMKANWKFPQVAALLGCLLASSGVAVVQAQAVGARPVEGEGQILNVMDFGAVPDPTSAHGDYTLEFSEDYGADLTMDWEDIAKKLVNKAATEVRRLLCRVGPQAPKAPPGIDIEANLNAINAALAAAQPGDTVLIPDGYIFSTLGGVMAINLTDVTIDIAGSLNFIQDNDLWPRSNDTFTYQSGIRVGDYYLPGFSLWGCQHVTVTCSSSNKAQATLSDNQQEIKLATPQQLFGGMLNGNGQRWWYEVLFMCFNFDFIANPTWSHNPRPRLAYVMESEYILVEKITLVNSPYWSFSLDGNHLEVSHVDVVIDTSFQTSVVQVHEYVQHEHMGVSREDANPFYSPLLPAPRSTSPYRGQNVNHFATPVLPTPSLPTWKQVWNGIRYGGAWYLAGQALSELLGHNPLALNTDGIDPCGHDIYIHDGIITNSDDSIAVKPSRQNLPEWSILPNCTTDIVISQMTLSGFGASIGSVPPRTDVNCVDGVHFKDIYMPYTGRGIYVKSNGNDCQPPNKDDVKPTAIIKNILYEDVTMLEPQWWPIWIGPQQQQQPGDSLGLKCSLLYPIQDWCPSPDCATFENIALKNIDIQYNRIEKSLKDIALWPWVGSIQGNVTFPNMESVTFSEVSAKPINFLRPTLPWPFRVKGVKRSYLDCVGVQQGVQYETKPKTECLTIVNTPPILPAGDDDTSGVSDDGGENNDEL